MGNEIERLKYRQADGRRKKGIRRSIFSRRKWVGCAVFKNH